MSSSSSSASSICSDAAFKPSQSPSYKFVAPPHPSANLRTLLRYIDALNRMDNDAVLDCFDESLEHRILPKSIGRPVLNKKQYGDYFRGIISFFKEIRIGLFEVVEAGDKMTIHGSGTGESITGTPYKNEFMIIMHFTSPAPNGETKICLVKEFVDGMSTVKFFTDERTKAREKAQAETKAKTREAEVRAQARAAAFSSR